MIRGFAFVILAFLTVATLLSAPASAQQFFPAGRAEVTLSTGFTGGSSFSLNLSYGPSAWPLDLLFRVTSLESGGPRATAFLFGARTYIRIPSPHVMPYFLKAFSTVSVSGVSSSALVVGAGATFNLSGPVTAYSNVLTNTTGGGLGYDIGIQYAVMEQFSLMLGHSTTNVGISTNAAYVGAGLRF